MPGEVQHDTDIADLAVGEFQISVIDWSSTSAPTGDSFEAIERRLDDLAAEIMQRRRT